MVCDKCHNTDIDVRFIEEQGFNHCLCKKCDAEWIE